MNFNLIPLRVHEEKAPRDSRILRVFDINFSLISSRVPEKKGLDRQTDGQQSENNREREPVGEGYRGSAVGRERDVARFESGRAAPTADPTSTFFKLNISYLFRCVRPLSLFHSDASADGVEDRSASQAERLGRSYLSIARSALSLARSAQAERDNESRFFVRPACVHRFIRRYHIKKKHCIYQRSQFQTWASDRSPFDGSCCSGYRPVDSASLTTPDDDELDPYVAEICDRAYGSFHHHVSPDGGMMVLPASEATKGFGGRINKVE
ncbi:hypothetical protein EVAR_25431_1 [Eumeta japonica]|uniref:Uncharacterized protein n=1 Tax=Eumeta variegata TaxID=151549 RepID=A0A4C1V5F6_EUMVA|nr:hypothetical protein EVAR_25431_1 [Eumeta japonica]